MRINFLEITTNTVPRWQFGLLKGPRHVRCSRKFSRFKVESWHLTFYNSHF